MAERKPRVRKTETVRERNAKAVEKAERSETRASKAPIRKVAKVAAKPFKIFAWPFKLRPVRFVFRWLGRILGFSYIRNSYKELRQVKWPKRRDTWKLTFAVLIFAVVFGLFAKLSDYGFDKIIKRIVLR